MNVRATLSMTIAALVVGCLIGHFIPPLFTGETDEAAEQAETGKVAKKPARERHQTGNSADLNRLRARIRDLERQLADKTKAPDAEPAEEISPNGDERRKGPPTAAEMRARFEEMRVNDPERYTQITNNMAHWRARRQERVQNQFNLLANADTAHMTKAQRKVHESYQNLLARQEELHEIVNPNNTGTTDEQREAAFKELRENWRQLQKLQRTERDTLLTQTANSMGYTGEDAKEVVSAIKAVYEATGGGDRDGHGRHGRRGGPPPGGGGPGRGR